MEFSVSPLTENGLSQAVLTDPANRTQVTILPDYGALLHSFSIETANGLHNIIDNYDDAKAVEEGLSTSFKSSKLSPFVCRIAKGKYTYDGKEFELENKFTDGSAIHGLLYNKAFKKTQEFADGHKASVVFTYNYKEEEDGYPFSYSCSIRYTLLPRNTLQVQTTVTSLDDLPIPMMDGWHPYFTLGTKVNDLLLFINAGNIVEFDDSLVPTGRLLPYDAFDAERPIGAIELDNCFLLNDSNGYPACTLRNNSSGLELNIFTDSSYPYLQLYTPPHRASIAIENLSGAPNAFNNHMGLLMLQPRHAHTFTVHYQVNAG